MRVVGGSARGRRLAAPRGNRVRPTADRIKEALFNILHSGMEGFEGARVLDLFAGTGNLGIEALSRGCSEAVFVDSHRESVTVIRRNLDELGFGDRARIIARDALSAIDSLEREGAPFRLVVIDPPYRLGLADKVLGRLAESPLIAEETIIVVESAVDEVLPDLMEPLHLVDRRTYGDTALSFFRKRN
ncbi:MULTISPECIES: 16S rRNA (guanine(966)-N(2))-methyltransferase RsmD [Geobacter]|uniref:16S rRNA (guanine(966)-N(2))-methyltransferase RsmD n=1 Tax=Geobacter TaxID=28231 RepID=UPI002572E136|nr:16S rRNA (guanine(966)-N(2))-methyltransferase RsmD [Geobacter sulfurreducens]BEH10765.1 16S rRNA (guanine(966)-N(2))-methyltransferase RsmD [Geobacter sulfurreducens subsp. ethanolicus]BET58610.1 16S rRNA (guanine(966)-N(2))-methyltransferase RsmD [Geobacter sp. 60473]